MPEFYPEIREKKNALREEYRKKRSDLDMQQRQQKDEAIAKRFLSFSVMGLTAKAIPIPMAAPVAIPFKNP